MDPYSISHDISLSEVGPSIEVRLSALVCLMQDAASNHAAVLGVGYEDLTPINRAFILSRFAIEIDHPLPKWEERIEVRTWPRLLDRLFALRDYEIVDASKRSVLRGTSAWLLIDTEKRRPARPHAQLLGLTPRKVCALGEDDPEKLPWENDTEFLENRVARASDLDPNSHVNNSRYIDWVTDAIARKYGPSTAISGLCINFLSEIRFGQQVSIGTREQGEGIVTVQGETDRPTFSAKVRLR